jgi:A/G-specific adenine glycosylase
MARVDIAPGAVPVLRTQLLEWFSASRRDLPWRQSRDPYAIWVSEIMLQQTRVAVVIERYRAFLERFPTLQALAEAPDQDVLALWSGLGYYRRARMLHKAAQFVVSQGGQLPTTAEGLRTLPGIGAYTSAAIASIVHNERVAVVDGNVERVLCRLQGWEAPRPRGATASRKKVDALAALLVDPERPGDFNQAMMELGAIVCLPRNPNCMLCPLAAMCDTRGEHPTVPRPRMLSKEIGRCLALRLRPDAKVATREVLLEQRPETETVMPGMWELPLLIDPDVPDHDLRLTVRHAIMQVNYYVRVRAVPEPKVSALTVPNGERRWMQLNDAGTMALTGLTRKILQRAHLLAVSHHKARPGRPRAHVVK